MGNIPVPAYRRVLFGLGLYAFYLPPYGRWLKVGPWETGKKYFVL